MFTVSCIVFVLICLQLQQCDYLEEKSVHFLLSLTIFFLSHHTVISFLHICESLRYKSHIPMWKEVSNAELV